MLEASTPMKLWGSTTAEELCDALLRAYGKVRPTKSDRMAYHTVLVSISLFLQNHGHKDCAHWINQLAHALEDLEKTGQVWAVLRPAKTGPNKTLPVHVQWRHQFVAAGVKCLILSGIPREKAARQATRQVRTIRGTSWRTVLSWMDELGKKRSRSKLGVGAYPFLIPETRDPVSLKRGAKGYFQYADLIDYDIHGMKARF